MEPWRRVLVDAAPATSFARLELTPEYVAALRGMTGAQQLRSVAAIFYGEPRLTNGVEWQQLLAFEG